MVSEKKFKKVAVLMGGVSSERDVSVRSGTAVAEGLAEAGYDVTPIELKDESIPPLDGFDAVFVALHGRFGEDGGAQKILEERGAFFTGSSSASCADSFDKIRTREILANAGLPVPEGEILAKDAPVSSIKMQPPFVVKPPREGSSVGVTIVRDASEIQGAIDEGRKYADGDLLIERFIPGREWTAGIVGDKALPVIEISPKLDGGWYSWKAKYFANGTTSYTFPADSSETDAALCERCKSIALEVFRALKASGLSRVDFRVTPDGEPFILELNAIPGFTAASLLPKAAAKAGIPFAGLCASIMESAHK